MNSIVIARYKESIDWILDIPDGFEIFLYNKGEKITSPSLINRAHHIIDRPNVGRESETYLHHMMTGLRGDDSFTVFTQGDPFTHSPDFMRLLRSWREWDSLQPLTWQWRSDHNIPPAYLLSEYERHLAGRLRVRPERFSLSTWGAPDFVDVGAHGTARDYRIIHGGLPEGTNIAAHFLSLCKLDDLARKAQENTFGVFCYGAIFAARNSLVAELPLESAQMLYQATKGHACYGYVLERMWLHFFGANFSVPRAAPVSAQPQTAAQPRMASAGG